MKQVNKENNLAVVNPTLAAEWDYQKNKYLPERYLPKAGSKVYWVCSLGHSWEAAIYSRSQGNNCPICAGHKASPTNNLAKASPELIKEWDYENNLIGPEYYTPKSNKKVYWKCQICSHSWRAVIHTRATGVGCPYCAGQLVTSTRNLAVCFPELLAEWDYTKNTKLPEEYLPRVRKKVWWNCPLCRYTWEADIVARSRGFKKCPYCYKPKGGFDQSSPAYFYIQHIHINGCFALIKFGITNRDPRIRMFEIQKSSEGKHRLQATEYFDVGRHALHLEQDIKDRFRKDLNPLNLNFDGATETIAKTKITEMYSFIGGLQWLSDLIWEPRIS
jgi:hypothetical protein